MFALTVRICCIQRNESDNDRISEIHDTISYEKENL